MVNKVSLMQGALQFAECQGEEGALVSPQCVLHPFRGSQWTLPGEGSDESFGKESYLTLMQNFPEHIFP